MRSVLLWILLQAAFLAQAQKRLTVASDDAMVNLAFQAEYMEDAGGRLTLDQVREPSMNAQFRQNGSRIFNVGLTNSFFWIRFNLLNKTDEALILEVGNSALTDLKVYEINRGLLVKQFHSGNWLPIERREIKNVNYLFPLKVLPGEESTIYLRVMHFRGTQFPLKAGSLTAIYTKDTRRSLQEGIYYGFMLLMVLYNLFLFFSLRDNAYLYYVSYIFFMALLNASINGFAFRYFWPSVPVINRFDDVFASLTGISGILFAASFLNTKKNAPLIHHVFKGLLVVYVVAAVLILTSNFKTGLLILEINSLVLVISFFIGAYQTMRSGYKPAKFFLIAWSFLLLSVFVFILNNLNLVPSSSIVTHSLQIGSAVEALLLSLALANRINVYKEEKRVAQLQALRSLEKNKKLIVRQNMMLEQKVAERTTELKKANGELLMALQNLEETQAQLVEKEKMASLGELTAGIAHEIQNPLNFVNNFSEVSNELVEEMKQELEKGRVENAATLADDLQGNLQKINFHGKRADSIVKSMLDHSRTTNSKREATAVNELVDKAIRLAFYSIRVSDKTFTAVIETHYDETVKYIEMVADDVNRVLLNIFNNAFYAMREKKKQALDGYQPVLSVRTENAEQGILIRIRDNGTGIPQKVQNKIYQPFFTTKPAGEGTGLGLSLSYDIITKEHGGTLQVDTLEGQFTEFVIALPLRLNVNT